MMKPTISLSNLTYDQTTKMFSVDYAVSNRPASLNNVLLHFTALNAPYYDEINKMELDPTEYIQVDLLKGNNGTIISSSIDWFLAESKVIYPYAGPMVATIDPDNSLDEQNESDNEMSMTINYAPPTGTGNLYINTAAGVKGVSYVANASYVDKKTGTTVNVYDSFQVDYCLQGISSDELAQMEVSILVNGTPETMIYDLGNQDECASIYIPLYMAKISTGNNQHAAGTYEIVVNMDPNNLINEVKEEDNQYLARVDVPNTIIDLAIVAVSHDNEENVLDIEYHIHNPYNSVSAQNSFSVRVEINGIGNTFLVTPDTKICSSNNTPECGILKSNTLSVGHYNLTGTETEVKAWIVIDPSNSIVEADETNNGGDLIIPLVCSNIYYLDQDNDGFGDATSKVIGCSTPKGYSVNKTDNCPSDSNVEQFDQDNDGKGDICDADLDGDGVDNSLDCDAYDASQGLPFSYYYDSDQDNYGAGILQNSCTFSESYVYAASQGNDANNYDSTIYPGAPEYCDGKDNNQDGKIDESSGVGITYYADPDKDTKGSGSGMIFYTCSAPAGYVSNNLDNCPNISNVEQYDLDKDGQGDVCDSDKDGDGMPNDWEDQYGLSSDFYNASGDFDGDSYTNYQEYQLGLDPNLYATIIHSADIFDSPVYGIWNYIGDGFNVKNDPENFIEGNGSVSFDMVVNQSTQVYAGMNLNSQNPLDLSNYASSGTVRFWIYLPEVTHVYNIRFLLGNDDHNFWDWRIYESTQGAFKVGWNPIMVSTSTPAQIAGLIDPKLIDFASIRINYDGSQTDQQNYRIDAVTIE
ncbi:MAG: cartilage oligomeric matrix protein [Candidatus Peregrinibacteria bacterium GW2011_GWE2_39_6]|nr:MAG: cartilage oligomeric matrix protein [Candidatus Peregrinibacteria bacterium GW2011_GWE2_39_6]